MNYIRKPVVCLAIFFARGNRDFFLKPTDRLRTNYIIRGVLEKITSANMLNYKIKRSTCATWQYASEYNNLMVQKTNPKSRCMVLNSVSLQRWNQQSLVWTWGIRDQLLFQNIKCTYAVGGLLRCSSACRSVELRTSCNVCCVTWLKQMKKRVIRFLYGRNSGT